MAWTGSLFAQRLSIMRIYLAITVILSLYAWTELARVVRGRFLAMREEDFTMAGEARRRERHQDHIPPYGAKLH